MKNNNKEKSVKEEVKVVTKKKPLYIFRVLFVMLVIVLVYIAVNFVKIFNKKTISIYEVSSGEIVNVDKHTGFIFREEKTEICNTNGYINFYVANADRVGRGSFIYSIDDEEKTLNISTLTNDDKRLIRQEIKRNILNLTNDKFYNIYNIKNAIDNRIKEINTVKWLEEIDVEKEIIANEKGYARNAGIISFIIDGYENSNIKEFNDDFLKSYNKNITFNQKKEVLSGDKVYKIITNPTYQIAFDSDYNYDEYKKNFVTVKFVYENLTAIGHVDSFIGNDGKKHYVLNITEFPERFIDKRVVDFEIENKKITGLKIPLKSIVSKNCYMIPKNMLEIDDETNENVFLKLGPNGEKNRITCNISKEDNDYYYVSIDDMLSNLRYGDVLINRYGDTYSLSDIVKLDGVYNVNKGYAVFKNVEVIDRTNEYVIIRDRTGAGISLYDHIALDAEKIKEGDLIA